jgi:hypothetical protein
VLEFLARAIRQEKEKKKGMQMGKEVKLFPFKCGPILKTP